jgi:CTP:molybdopterin cytidylyltransferase MocA
MGAPKAELVVAGARLIDRAVRAAREARCDPVIAVVRPGTEVADAEVVGTEVVGTEVADTEIAGAEVAGAVRVVVNADPDRGMRSSLALAVESVTDVDALAVLLVDAPGVTAQAIRAVVAAWQPGRVAVASYPRGRGHPTVMALELWRAALELAGADEGARAFLAAQPGLVDEVAVPGDPGDLDTPDDLTGWRAGR